LATVEKIGPSSRGERGVAGFLAGVFGWGRVYLSILLDDFKATCSET
jgi:hypothetical protein